MKILILCGLIAAASGIQIGCNFGNAGWGSLIGTLYSCQITSMTLSANSTHVTGYSGNHLSGYTSADVRGVYIHADGCTSFNLTSFPRGFSALFPDIFGLYFSGCPYGAMNGDELIEYPNLKRFSTIYTNLISIPRNIFNLNPSMSFIEFHSNKIETVGEGLLDNLQNLTIADFRFNVCINMQANNASQIPALIQALRNQCPDNEPSTTTTTLITTPVISTTYLPLTNTTLPPSHPEKCFDDFIENFICDLSDNHEGLDRKVGILENRVRYLEGFGDQVEELKQENLKIKEKNEKLMKHVEKLEGMIVEIRKNFDHANEELEKEDEEF